MQKEWKGLARILVGLAILAICVLIVIRLQGKQSVKAVANQAVGCMASGDGNCIFETIEEHEKSALELTPEKISILLREYVLPSYGSLGTTPSKDQTQIGDAGIVNATWQWSRSGQMHYVMGAVGVATPSGAKTTCTTEWMIFHAMDARYRRDVNTPSLLVYIEGIERDTEKLKKLGIRGVYAPSTRTVTEWSEILVRYRKSAMQMGMIPKG